MATTYTQRADYFKQIKAETLEEIIQGNDYLLDEVERIAEAEITSYLIARYDIKEEFKKTPPGAGKIEQRNSQIVMWLVDIALYHLHSRINPRNIPQLRIIRYDGNDPRQSGGAIGALKMATKGTITLDLPEYDEDEDEAVGLVYGSANDFESRPFEAARRKSLGEHRLVKTYISKK